MALITCNECGKDYSDTLDSCFQCGKKRGGVVKYDNASPKGSIHLSKLSSKLPVLISLMFVLTLGLYLIKTVPLADDFNTYIESKVESAIEANTSNNISKWWFKGVTNLSKSTRTEYYILYSINYVEFGKRGSIYLGIAGNFIQIGAIQ